MVNEGGMTNTLTLPGFGPVDRFPPPANSQHLESKIEADRSQGTSQTQINPSYY